MAALQRAPFLVGAALTLLTAGADQAGLFDGLEARSRDARQRRARTQREAMDPQVVHVDVDDQALRTQGRWPWPRERFAAALRELGRAGAGTVVLDILFSDPQAAGLDAEGGRVDHDRELAEALSELQVLLAVAPAPIAVEAGSPSMQRALAVLGEDVGAPMDAVLARLPPDAEVQRACRDHGGTLREQAARQRLQDWWSAQDAPAIEDFLAEVRADERRAAEESATRGEGRVATEGLWQRVLREHRAWTALRRSFREGEGDGAGDVPLPVFAEAAAGAGFVNFSPDPDGKVRSMPVVKATPGGEALQLGVAAVALHQGLMPHEVDVDESRVRVGDVELPLVDGRLDLAWPTGEGGWWKLHQGRAGTVIHVSLGFVLELAEARESCQRLIRQRDEFALQVARDLLDPDLEAVDDALRAEVEGELSFLAEDLAALQEAGEELQPEEQEMAAALADWARLHEGIEVAQGVVRGGEAQLREAVGGRLVFVGWASTGSATDVVPTAVDAQTPGVVVHALMADMLLRGRSLAVLPEPWSLLLVLALGVACCWISARCSPMVAAIACAYVILGYTLVVFWIFAGQLDLMVPLVAPVASGGFSLMGSTALTAALASRDRRRITRQFEARVGRELVHFLLENPEALSASGSKREITILFADLAGFTALSEKLGGERTVPLLNRCMVDFTRELVDRGAYVNKFLGDGLMAFWSAFREDPDQERKACAAALRCAEVLEVINAESEAEGLPRLAVRLGIATGEVIVGDCGAPPVVHDYTVIGDAVNLSARLESANKQFGTHILMDGRTRAGLQDEWVRPLGKVAVVGQRNAVEVFELLSEEMPPERRARLERALHSFQDGRLEDSRLEWGRLVEEHGEDPLARRYLEAIEAGRVEDGVLELQSK